MQRRLQHAGTSRYYAPIAFSIQITQPRVAAAAALKPLWDFLLQLCCSGLY